MNDQAISMLPDRYLAMWNEPDVDLRSRMVQELWAPDGVQVLVDPPQAMRDALEALAFPIPSVPLQGREALSRRIGRAYEMFVAPGEYTFKPRGLPTRLLANLVGFGWGMVRRDDDAVAGGGYEVVSFNVDSLIRLDHMYVGIES